MPSNVYRIIWYACCVRLYVRTFLVPLNGVHKLSLTRRTTSYSHTNLDLTCCAHFACVFTPGGGGGMVAVGVLVVQISMYVVYVHNMLSELTAQNVCRPGIDRTEKKDSLGITRVTNEGRLVHAYHVT